MLSWRVRYSAGSAPLGRTATRTSRPADRRRSPAGTAAVRPVASPSKASTTRRLARAYLVLVLDELARFAVAVRFTDAPDLASGLTRNPPCSPR